MTTSVVQPFCSFGRQKMVWSVSLAKTKCRIDFVFRFVREPFLWTKIKNHHVAFLSNSSFWIKPLDWCFANTSGSTLGNSRKYIYIAFYILSRKHAKHHANTLRHRRRIISQEHFNLRRTYSRCRRRRAERRFACWVKKYHGKNTKYLYKYHPQHRHRANILSYRPIKIASPCWTHQLSPCYRYRLRSVDKPPGKIRCHFP